MIEEASPITAKCLDSSKIMDRAGSRVVLLPAVVPETAKLVAGSYHEQTKTGDHIAPNKIKIKNKNLYVCYYRMQLLNLLLRSLSEQSKTILKAVTPKSKFSSCIRLFRNLSDCVANFSKSLLKRDVVAEDIGLI
jgi:hypothetical protein